MITVAAVYRAGGDFKPNYVEYLSESIRRNLNQPYRFLLLTNEHRGRFTHTAVDEVRALDHNWPGWWSKMELFRLPGPVLYFDLDTVITGPIDDLAIRIREDRGLFLMLRGFYRRDRCSGVMGWNDDVSKIYRHFASGYGVATFRKRSNSLYLIKGRESFRGDQEWIRVKVDPMGIGVNLVQDVTPGVVSYKVDVRPNGDRLPPRTKIVCFHGTPRPHEVSPIPEWMKEHWLGHPERVGDPMSRVDYSAMRRTGKLTNYTGRHIGTLIVLGSAPGALEELLAVRRLRPVAKIAAVGYAAGITQVDFIVSDHYEVHSDLRRLQDQFGHGHYSTHCSLASAAYEHPAVDFWWNWSRAEASSVETAIRIGLEIGFQEIILCGVKLEAAKIQHPWQRKKDGDDWPPPAQSKFVNRGAVRPGPEVLAGMREAFRAKAPKWRQRVFGVSGLPLECLEPPRGWVPDPELAEDRPAWHTREHVERIWIGEKALDRVYREATGRWPDDDMVPLLKKFCRGFTVEIGCGTGRCAEAFEPGRYLGLDINPVAVEKACGEFPAHKFFAVEWDDPFPPAETYLFFTTLLHIPDGELQPMIKRLPQEARVVIFESMSEDLRNPKRGNFQRHVGAYRELLRNCGRSKVEVEVLPSSIYPYYRHIMTGDK